MDDHVQTELSRDGDGVVLGYVVNQDHLGDDLVWYVAIRPFEGLGRVVGGHDDDDAASGSNAVATLRGGFGRGGFVGGRLRPHVWHADSVP